MNSCDLIHSPEADSFTSAMTAKTEAAVCGAEFPPPLVPNTTDDSNPKDLIGDTKPPVWLVPPSALIRLSKVMQLGARKYGPYNWREKKVRMTVYIAAAQRHILQALDGEDIDPESGESHIAHAMACMAIILDAQATGNMKDDRPLPGAASKVIRELTEKRI
jgi:hypothetical protein